MFDLKKITGLAAGVLLATAVSANAAVLSVVGGADYTIAGYGTIKT